MTSNNQSNTTNTSDKLKYLENKFSLSHPKSAAWMKKQNISLEEVLKKTTAILAVASMITAKSAKAQRAKIFLNISDNLNPNAVSDLFSKMSKDEHQELFDKLTKYTKEKIGHLDRNEEILVEAQLSELLGFPVTAELDGHKLNHSFGIMGGEQHLFRFQGDVLANHDAYLESGIAPGRGAFGWFTEEGKLTSKAIMREKYYFAVQTLYLPDWNSNHRELKPWYKFRKMIVINPAEQIAVVGVVGDAGPALWVKKQFGGSPEVMMEGKIWSPDTRGKIILLFVDDPEDRIPLGPYDLKHRSEGEHLFFADIQTNLK